jgi:hypothetical protein
MKCSQWHRKWTQALLRRISKRSNAPLGRCVIIFVFVVCIVRYRLLKCVVP